MNGDKACPNLREYIAALVLGELKADTAQKLHGHIQHCPGCRRLYETMKDEEQVIETTFGALAQRGRGVESAVTQRISRRTSNRLDALLIGLRSRPAIRIAAVAAAAVLILATLVIVHAFRGRGQADDQVNPIANQTDTPDEGEAQVLARERIMVDRMSIAKDVAGLIGMLDTGLWQTKITTAASLGRIGDANAVRALGRYVGKWTGDTSENPFAKAIEQINQRTTGAHPETPSTKPAAPASENRGQAVKTPPTTQYVLCGHITDADTGQPVTDARVEISLFRIFTTEVDANGFYRFEKIEKDGNHRVRIYSRNHIGFQDSQVPVVGLRTDTQMVRDFQLRKACQIEVQVVDEQGRPIKGARLLVSSMADAYGRANVGIYSPPQTDSNGIALLGGFEPSDQGYRIIATHEVAGPMVERNGKIPQPTWDYAPGHLIVNLTDTNVLETGQICLQKGVDVKGYCEYADGVPAGGLSISAYPDWWHSTSCPPMIEIDPNGGFTLPQIVPGRYTLEVFVLGGDGTGISFRVGEMEWPSQDPVLYVKVPKKSPQSLVSISGRITYIGTPSPSPVSISALGPSGDETVNLRQGQKDFMIGSLEPGTYTILFSGQGIQEKTIEGLQAPTSGLEVQLVCGEEVKPVLQGVVLRADTKQPVKRFKARAAKLRTLRGTTYTQSDGWTEFANDQGRFRIETVGPGVYQVQVAAEVLASAWSEEINTDEGRPVTVTLTTGGGVTGMVMDEQGRPVVNALVIPLSKACGTMAHIRDVFVSTDGSVRTDPKGVFTLAAIPAGLEYIKVVHDQYCLAIKKDIPVTEGQTTQGADVILSEGGRVEGQVFDPQGRPEPGVTLYVQDASGYLMAGGDEQAGRLATVVTDANGLYRIQHLPEQVCYIQRSNSWASLGVVRRAILPQAGTARRVDFGGLPVVTGQFLLNGIPLANAKVVLGDLLSRFSGVFECVAATDGQGRFRFSGVPAGRYGLFYENPTQRNDWIKASQIDTAGQDVDLGIVPGPSAEVRIYVKAADPGQVVQPARVVLQEGTTFWGPTSGSMEPPLQAGAPYVAKGVQPGTHTAMVYLPNHLMVRKQIAVQARQRDQDVTVQIPTGTAVLTGDLRSDGQQTLVLIRSDGQVMAYVYAESGPQYRIEGLPAGTYSVCGAVAQDKAPFVTFDLADGQTRRLDIDTSLWPAEQAGLLFVQVVGPDGIPLTTSQVWLEGSGRRIDPVKTLSEGHTFTASPGVYLLHVTHAGYPPYRSSVEIRPADLSGGDLRYKRSPVLVRLAR